MTYKDKFVRFMKEWGIFALIIGLLYWTNLHTEVIGRLQQAVIFTGILNASNELETENQTSTDYKLILENESGKTIHLSTFKSDVLFINFWATWCPPCRAEMPEIAELYEKKKEQVQFIMIASDKNFDKAKKFVRDKNYKFPIYRLRSALPPEFESQSIPSTFVVSKTGKIIFKRQGIAGYNNSKFIELLDDAQKK